MSGTGALRSGLPKPGVLAGLILDAARVDESPKDSPAGREKLVDDLMVWYRRVSGPARDEADYRSVLRRSIERSWRPGVALQQFAAVLASPDRTRPLAELDIPTLVIHGLVDPLVQPSGGIDTALAVPGSRLLMFPDMGHDLPRSRLDEIAEAIETLVRRAPETSTSTSTTTSPGASPEAHERKATSPR
jgi:pimeloyl-ACP methyl ester carboxylesterase